MKIKELLMADTCYYQVYKFLPWKNSKELGKMALMSMLIDAESIASERLKGNYEYFQCTNKFINALYRTGWSKNTLDNYFIELKKDGYIDILLIKSPNYTHAPRYVKINNQKLIDMYNLYNSQDLILKNQNLTIKSQNLYRNNNYKQELKQEPIPIDKEEEIKNDIVVEPVAIFNEEDIDIEMEKPKKKRKEKEFVPPTIEEVIDYVNERNSSVNPHQFFDYFNVTGWVDSNGKKVRSWKQKLITWENHSNGYKNRKHKKVTNIPDNGSDKAYMPL